MNYLLALGMGGWERRGWALRERRQPSRAQWEGKWILWTLVLRCDCTLECRGEFCNVPMPGFHPKDCA